MLKVQEISQTFEDDLGVRVPDGTKAIINELFKELLGICHIEIPCDRQISAGGVVLSNEGMAITYPAIGMSPVSKVSEIGLPYKSATLFQLDFVVRRESVCANGGHVPHRLIEDSFDGIPFGRAQSTEERLTGGHVELDGGNTSTILPPVPLFFHQQMEAPKTPRHIVVAGGDLVERPLEPYHRQSTFMPDWITHRRVSVLAGDAFGYWDPMRLLGSRSMNDEAELQSVLAAASDCWDHLAAFAWRSYAVSGPGAVLVLKQDLLATEGGPPPMNYFAREDIPPGDDFRSLMDTYQPASQVMLMIGSPEGEQVLVIEAQEGLRARPDSFEYD